MVQRYKLPGNRELRTGRAHGRIFVGVYDVAGSCSSGPLALREDELDSLRSALADLAGETLLDGIDLAPPAREAGRIPPAVAGGPRRATRPARQRPAG